MDPDRPPKVARYLRHISNRTRRATHCDRYPATIPSATSKLLRNSGLIPDPAKTAKDRLALGMPQNFAKEEGEVSRYVLSARNMKHP